MTSDARERADKAQAFGNGKIESQECMTMKDARETLLVRVEPITAVATHGFALAPLSLKLS
jgi:hypothetical protein